MGRSSLCKPAPKVLWVLGRRIAGCMQRRTIGVLSRLIFKSQKLNFPEDHPQYITEVSKRTSKYRGVCYHSDSGKWRAKISVIFKEEHLGSFRDQVEAAKVYDVATVT